MALKDVVTALRLRISTRLRGAPHTVCNCSEVRVFPKYFGPSWRGQRCTAASRPGSRRAGASGLRDIHLGGERAGPTLLRRARQYTLPLMYRDVLHGVPAPARVS